MDISEAKELLSFHSCRNSHVDDPKWKNGFLGSLRPFCGELHKENFVEVIECLRALKNNLSEQIIEQAIVSDIVSIIHLTRSWVSPYGMLGSNHLLTDVQTKHLSAWVDIIETCFMYLLDNVDEEAFRDYKDYLNGEYPL